MISNMLILYIVIIGLFIIVGLGGKFTLFAVTLAFKRFLYKGQVGLIFYRGIGNTFGLPVIVDLRETRRETSQKLHPFSREQFRDGTFFGCPYILCDVEDIKTSVGLYINKAKKSENDIIDVNKLTANQIITLFKQQCDEEGRDIAHTCVRHTEDGQEVKYYTPVLDTIKTSNSLDPELLKKSYSATALSHALDLFLKKHQLLMILIGGAIVLSLIGAYFAYVNNSQLALVCQQTTIDAIQGQLKALLEAKVV